jgi:hypothetical protein
LFGRDVNKFDIKKDRGIPLASSSEGSGLGSSYHHWHWERERESKKVPLCIYGTAGLCSTKFDYMEVTPLSLHPCSTIVEH